MIENIGGIIQQFLIFTVLFLLLFVGYFAVRYFVQRKTNQEPGEKVIEDKIEKVINFFKKNKLDKL